MFSFTGCSNNWTGQCGDVDAIGTIRSCIFHIHQWKHFKVTVSILLLHSHQSSAYYSENIKGKQKSLFMNFWTDRICRLVLLSQMRRLTDWWSSRSFVFRSSAMIWWISDHWTTFKRISSIGQSFHGSSSIFGKWKLDKSGVFWKSENSKKARKTKT